MPSAGLFHAAPFPRTLIAVETVQSPCSRWVPRKDQISYRNPMCSARQTVDLVELSLRRVPSIDQHLTSGGYANEVVPERDVVDRLFANLGLGEFPLGRSMSSTNNSLPLSVPKQKPFGGVLPCPRLFPRGGKFQQCLHMIFPFRSLFRSGFVSKWTSTMLWSASLGMGLSGG